MSHESDMLLTSLLVGVIDQKEGEEGYDMYS